MKKIRCLAEMGAFFSNLHEISTLYYHLQLHKFCLIIGVIRILYTGYSDGKKYVGVLIRKPVLDCKWFY